ncbi:MAG: hypothetical protein WD011_08635, partial [Nitriliruptoraceae bacterium]
MHPAFRRYIDAASGVTELTTKRAEQVARSLARAGEVASDQVGELVDDLIKRQEKNRKALSKIVKAESERALRAMDVVTGRERRELEARIASLEKQVEQLRGSSTTAPSAKKATAKKATAKKATAK